MTIVINFGNILYWTGIVAAGVAVLWIVGAVLGAFWRELQQPWKPKPGEIVFLLLPIAFLIFNWLFDNLARGHWPW